MLFLAAKTTTQLSVHRDRRLRADGHAQLPYYQSEHLPHQGRDHKKSGGRASMETPQSCIAYSEKLLEDYVRDFPLEFLGEPLTLDSQQLRLAGFRPDLVFRDPVGIPTIVEIQIGPLDRNHLYRVLEYRDLLRLEGGHSEVRVILVANTLPERYRSLLDIHAVRVVLISAATLAARIQELRPGTTVTFEREGDSSYRSFGPVSAALISLWQTEHRTIWKSNSADRSTLGITAKQEREALARLCRSGWIARIQKGVYLLNKELDFSGKASPHAVSVNQGTYVAVFQQVSNCGPSCFPTSRLAAQRHDHNPRIQRQDLPPNSYCWKRHRLHQGSALALR